MKYLYFPGCSLDETALEYNLSTRALMENLGVELVEIRGWVCCGASAAGATSDLLAIALPARTLALGEQMEEADEVLVPCSACYLNLLEASEKMKMDPALFERINIILGEDNLELKNRLKIRHLLDVVVNDIGVEAIGAKIKQRMDGFSIAPYYGCQCLRPYALFDDPEDPKSMNGLITVTGATVYDWGMGAVCCGASHISIKPDVSVELVSAILKGAREADVILSVCPMCQMNLEAYQQKISSRQHENLQKTILYLPQFLGMAMGLSEDKTRLDLNLAITREFKQKIEGERIMDKTGKLGASSYSSEI